ncbi:MAG: GntP family permease [Cyclobacteriaceae bacterium]|nr:GntP family permease [Cyclobacteriaceae bacterium]MDH4296452.1 GntP family permease [Cyclobacteriaceae bacterium]MDH5249397.1 GntP family permease [Cyclobacteriaceae bacterium]
MFTLLMIFIALAFIIVAIIKYDIHPFLALFVGAIGYGLITGMSLELIVQSISDGFGGVLGKIGLVILLGVIIGTFLEKTGGALVIAQKVLSYIGEKSVVLAMMITGWILSIPVFGDSAFIMLNPISKSLSFKAKVPFISTTIALTLGITASHSLVPPTPGPIATAGILGADLGIVILWGAIISLVALVPCFYFAKYATTRVIIIPKFAEGEKTGHRKPPSLGKSSLPIIVPLFFIVLASIANYPTHPFGDNSFTTVLQFVGNPVIALLLGAFASFMLPEKFDRKLLSSTGWIGDALIIAAPIILITGAGGVFGKMLQNSGIAEIVSSNLSGAKQLGLLLPFIMALALKTAQGSSTVAMITTASVVAPLLVTLGLDTEMLRAFTVLAIGAGAIAISHANDSFFWVMTQMSGMNIKQGNQTHSLGTLLLSCTAITLIFVITFFL